MGYESLALRRKIAGRVGAVILCLSLALAIDGMIAGGRQDPRAVDSLPGQSLPLDDVMPRGAEKLTDLRIAASDPRVAPRLNGTDSGFWLGGVLWRARLEIPADTPPGLYTFEMLHANGTRTSPRQLFRIAVYGNESELRAASLSLSTRLLGLPAYGLAAALLPLALLPMAASYLLSRRIALALRERGLAEIFRAMASPEGQRVFFALPPGAQPPQDTLITVRDEEDTRDLGQARIVTCARGDAEAVMLDGANVRPGTLADFGPVLRDVAEGIPAE